jgi:hypothetical protein
MRMMELFVKERHFEENSSLLYLFTTGNLY